MDRQLIMAFETHVLQMGMDYFLPEVTELIYVRNALIGYGKMGEITLGEVIDSSNPRPIYLTKEDANVLYKFLRESIELTGGNIQIDATETHVILSTERPGIKLKVRYKFRE